MTVESICASPSLSPASVDLERDVITASPVLADPADDDGGEGDEDEGDGDLDADGDEEPDGAGVGLELHPKRSADMSTEIKSNVMILFIQDSCFILLNFI